MQVFTCKGPVNIAVIKYWGKRDEHLILPVNSSLSVTLNQEELCTTTTVAASSNFTEDQVWVNGRETSIAETPRIQNCLASIRKLAQEQSDSSRWKELKNCRIHVCSVNNFPTAAGLASSASGYACLVFALARLFNVQGDLSRIARLGSGSACRSIYGGFVKWKRGERRDGNDSIAVQVFPESHWTDLRILILVVSDNKKSTSSTEGMRRSVATSELLKLRAEYIVPRRMEEMEKALEEKNFETFAELSMKDSNQFHAVCLDTYPPIEPPYMNSTSHHIVQFVTQYNHARRGTKVAYTFDAGPNAVLFVREKDVAEIASLVKHFFGQASDTEFIRGIAVEETDKIPQISSSLSLPTNPGQVKYVIHTKVGGGPVEISSEKHGLLDCYGLPKNLSVT